MVVVQASWSVRGTSVKLTLSFYIFIPPPSTSNWHKLTMDKEAIALLLADPHHQSSSMSTEPGHHHNLRPSSLGARYIGWNETWSQITTYSVARLMAKAMCSSAGINLGVALLLWRCDSRGDLEPCVPSNWQPRNGRDKNLRCKPAMAWFNLRLGKVFN